ncbi:hypothetical protein [Paracidovorax konjaci]|uniref:Uncharacterized protein n=1 Tax=Paracidovorax konjaci TaxID=32040 RepID=A0A1I1ZMP7_9BURK|nr:hypothetical protein [Paracidovorax konjaci]SFE32902.1 hypothetical protein SAMN04489710_13110 [Paracidovorax konjaci]
MPYHITIGAVVLTADHIELRVRALEGNVAELEAFDGSFAGYRHISSLTLIPQAGEADCSPPATQTAPAQSLAAAAGVGQGAGTCPACGGPAGDDFLLQCGACIAESGRYAGPRMNRHTGFWE